MLINSFHFINDVDAIVVIVVATSGKCYVAIIKADMIGAI